MKFNMKKYILFAIVSAWMAGVSCSATVVERMRATELRCEYELNPLGIDTSRPRLSWTVHSTKRNVQQAAYRVLVASTPELLAQDNGDLWDSGKVQSDQSHQVVYSGKPLASHQRYCWKVKVWQKGNGEGQWSDPGNWTTAVLAPKEWRAQWIAKPSPSKYQVENFEGAQWIWGLREGETVDTVAPGPCHLLRRFSLPKGVTVERAQLMVTADNSATIKVNGNEVAKTTDWKQGKIVDVKDQLVAGDNTLHILAVNGTDRPSPAGMICSLSVVLGNGQTLWIVSDRQWSVAAAEDSDVVMAANEIAPWEQGPWGESVRFIHERANGNGLPVFRKTFEINDGFKKALVHVAGLGHYELFLNGRKVGNRFLDTAWSVYEKTAYYSSYDITKLLREGENEFRIMLGKGFYNTHGDRRVHGVNKTGQLMAFLEARVEYADGQTETIITDDSWDAAAGPILHSAILAGSDYDARLAEPAVWLKAEETTAEGSLRASESPAMRTFERLAPVKPVEEPSAGVFVYDFGQNLSAIPSVTVRGNKGQTIRLTPAEQRHGQTDRQNNGTGRVNQAGVGSPNYYEYTLGSAGSESWAPQFTYGGFQYLEVTGAVPAGHPNPKQLPVIEAIRSVHVRSAARSVGAFSCSNPLFNQIDQSIDRAVRSNLAHVLTDCPTREKLGWLEVSYLMGPSISRRYDLSRLYAKVTRDIRDSQGEDGAIYTVAPNYPVFAHGFRYTPEWGAAGVILPWQLYRWYGDQRVLQENLPAMKQFVDYMQNTSTDLVPLAGLGDWYDYGHGKGNGPAKFTPATLTAMATFYRCADIVAKTAEVLGENEDATAYRKLATEIRTQFNAKFYVGKGEYQNHGSCQTANAMALVIGLCEPENEAAVLGAILADLNARGYQQTAGDVGFHYLMEALGRYGCGEVVYQVLNRRDEGSYGFIVDRGWSALPEAWDANTHASMNHCMLGHAQQWFYMDLLGIRQAEDSVAFKKLVIKPAFETGVEWATGHYDSVRGRIGVDWKQTGIGVNLSVSIPANSSATVFIPATDVTSVTESGVPAVQSEGVKFLRMDKGRAVFEVASGRYAFSAVLDG